MQYQFLAGLHNSYPHQPPPCSIRHRDSISELPNFEALKIVNSNFQNYIKLKTTANSGTWLSFGNTDWNYLMITLEVLGSQRKSCAGCSCASYVTASERTQDGEIL